MPKLLRIAPILPILLAAAVPAFAQVPGAPQSLTQSVNGTTVTLTWASPSTGGVPTSYAVEASFASGGTVIATLAVTGTTLVVPAVPVGTYFVRVRALNSSGTGPASSEAVVTVGGTGCPAVPLSPLFRVRSVGQQATLSWGPSGGCSPTSYALFAGTGPGLSNVTVVNAGSQLGLSATAPTGTYFVRVVGSNAFGNTVSQELVIRVAPNAQTETIDANQVARIPLQALRSGTYQASLIWDDPTINLDLYLTTPGCTSFPPTACQLASSTSTNAPNELVSQPITAGQSYELWIGNLSSRTTAFTVFNTIDGSPAFSAPSTTETSSPQDRQQ